MSKRRKLLVITDCSECPNFDNTYYDYAQKCTILERNIPQDDKHNHQIPDDCPLPNAEQTNEIE